MSKKILSLPAHVASLQPYESARSLCKGGEWSFMDANESPFAPTVELVSLPPLNRYPDPTADALRDAIGSFYGVARDNVIVTNGSDELIDLLVRSFVRPGRKVVSSAPTYGMYRVSAESNGVSYLSIPSRNDFCVDENALSTALDGADLLFLCSPNNPTGTVVERGVIEHLVESFCGLVVIDEAYGEFADAEGIPSSIDFVSNNVKNIIVMRTFSKAFGAAGIRLGYGIADASIIDTLLTMKPPYNVNVLTQTISLQLWNKRSAMEENIRLLLSERAKLMQGCEALGCTVFPSSTNFFLLEPPPGIPAETVYRSLVDQARFIIRRFNRTPMLENTLRVTVGAPEQNETFLSVLSSLL